MVNVDPAQRAVDFTEKVIESMYPDVVTDTDNANVRIWMGFDGKAGSGSVILEVTMKFSLNNGHGRDGVIVQRACVFDIMELPKSEASLDTQLGTRNNLERSSMKTVILILALATSVCALTTAHASQWKVYRDDVEGYSVTYPAFLRLIPPVERHPEADQNTSWVVQTKSFQSADGKVELYIESHPAAPDDSLETFFNTKIQNRTTGGDRVQYSLVKDNWYVISGVNTKGFEFYEKFYYFTKNGESWYVYWDFIYPHAQHKIYDALVAPIADGFVPNLRGEHE